MKNIFYSLTGLIGLTLLYGSLSERCKQSYHQFAGSAIFQFRFKCRHLEACFIIQAR